MDSSEQSRDSAARVGRYTLFERIGAGGMASVHLGRADGPAGFSRVVAIKRPHATYMNDPSFAAMIVDEIRLASAIRHPNVAGIIDVSVSADELLLVMEYIHGESLAALSRTCRERGLPIPVEVASAIAIGMLSGLHAAHEALSPDGQALSIVHRDVSPSNVLVGTDGLVRIIDFGVARATSRIQTTREGQLKGKLAYMSPEQVASRMVDRRSDIFAASVVYWELLTGRHLFFDDMPVGTMQNVLGANVLPPSMLRIGICPALDAIVQKGLAKEPNDRFETAKAMAVAIESATAVASATAVGAWVEHLFGAALRHRQARILEIQANEERLSALPPSLNAAMARVQASNAETRIEAAEGIVPRPKSNARLLLLGGALIAICLGLFLTFRPALRGRRSNAAVGVANASVVPPPPPAPTSAIADAGEPSSADVVATGDRSAASVGKAPAPPRGSTKAAKRNAHCDPPYVWDAARNVKVFKEECLR